MNAYKGRRVLLTGHTGFKGAWLSLWLKELGAEVIGYSLAPAFFPNLFTEASIEEKLEHIIGDVRDFTHLEKVMKTYQPEIVFHLAAQALVLPSFDDPKETFETNVTGTLNILEAIRQTPSVKACVIVTTDKCYRNKEWEFGYRENDELGGTDPYSTSKAMAELLVASYRSSFFLAKNAPAVATARAGNVIGGGDFSPFRILPDCLKALSQQAPILVRHPESVRPWLHVLDPLRGYLILGSRLFEEGHAFAESFNFGPKETSLVTVKHLVEETISQFGRGVWEKDLTFSQKKEMKTLRLSFEKASQKLSWMPFYDWKQAVKETVLWYQEFLSGKPMDEVCRLHLQEYLEREEAYAVF